MTEAMERLQWTLRIGVLVMGAGAAWYFFANGMQAQALTTLGSLAVILAVLVARQTLKPARGSPDIERSLQKSVRKVGARKDP